jgi:ATP-dependent helicase/nuclease subunit A
MSSNSNNQTKPELETARPLDADVLQNRASDPNKNVWVNASAGTGKTKVLTDRVLRLLLPDQTDNAGAAPYKILCLTYTKAAASEMLVRINQTLSDWAITPQNSLIEKLQKLLGHTPTARQIKSARALFAQITNVPGGMKIMTIHAFCQSTLGRFPLEANISPQAAPIEENESTALLKSALKNTITNYKNDPASPFAHALENIAATINEDQFFSLLQNTVDERYQFQQCLKENFGLDGLYTNLCRDSGVVPSQTPAAIIAEACKASAFDHLRLRQAAHTMLLSSKKTDLDNGKAIADFLAASEIDRPSLFDIYSGAFLKSERNEIYKSLATKETIEALPAITDILTTEAERLIDAHNRIKAATSAAITRDLLTVCEAVSYEYENIKTAASALDYNDLIIKTLQLLKEFPDWVMYKLDSGIDHILVDEAQDTNPEQWEIIERLCGEFYAHSTEQIHTRPRTLFVVGDDKQSIYSFQRAAPEKFEAMQSNLKNKVNAAGQKWEDVQLNISFRSTRAVLAAVDGTFAPATNTPVNAKTNPPPITHKTNPPPITHKSNRHGQAGLVELWPLFENDEDNGSETDIWAPVFKPKDTRSGSVKLAEHIARTIRSWLDNKELLPAYDRPVKPGDIMILMRTRSALVHQLMRALKNLDIPVSGADRLILGKDIAIQDLLALVLMTRRPQDDLNLACILKSPLIGMSEEALFEIAHKRTDTLWKNLQDKHPAIAAYLAAIKSAGKQRPYEFLTYILNSPCPACSQSGLSAFKNRLGESVTDVIDELLSMAIDYEQSHIPDLALFYDWFNRDNRTIKRESEDNADHVRIMTVHGAKGLQAPIVIMPDTIIIPNSGNKSAAERLLWPDKTGLKTPIWSPKKEFDHSAYTQARRALEIREEREYNRLLYVAMTRAEERLYVAGHISSKKPLESSWYYKIKAGLENHPDTRPAQTAPALLQLHYDATKEPDRTDQPEKQSTHSNQTAPRPHWIDQPAKAENNKPNKLVPSRQKETSARTYQNASDEKPMLSGSYARNRGIIIHKLLEILPLIPPENRKHSAIAFLEKFATGIPSAEYENMTTQTLTILDDPNFNPLFGPESLAEIPVTGYLPDGRLISGIIDRLLITPDTVMIIDYKTGEHVPESPAEISPAYQNQMQAYARALRLIYPDHTVKAALLWTDGPVLMPVIVDQALD